ncbi:MAG: hypothetical protein U1F10_09370 [Burkholderiales bacterium]
MRMFRLLALSTLFALAAGLAGCKVDTVNPVAPPAAAKADPALYGVWRYREKDEITYVHVGPAFALGEAKEGQPMRVVIVDHKPNGVTVEDYLAYGTPVGKQRYLSVAQEENGKRVGFLIVRYRVEGNAVRFATVDGKALAEAIRGGRIAGTTRGEGLAAETTITAEPAAIEAFLAGAPETLFNAPVTLRRVAGR